MSEQDAFLDVVERNFLREWPHMTMLMRNRLIQDLVKAEDGYVFLKIWERNFSLAEEVALTGEATLHETWLGDGG